uniref:Zinc finger BED domain-containing protein DAYSLEEPER-like isoform X2 n=1 Tax=Geotrypetes seraphini TaxID=260995 RepID=A0A6P8PHS0_GEOSA|nr:zinc finger BED domain-containing protein DAYSLEEPER-like isoform X2 [Geotrypetes seraphini]
MADFYELPAIVAEFYKDSEFVSKSEQDIKLKASCKECHKVITGCWKPKRVTSNFVCSPIAFKSFEDIKASRKRRLLDINSSPVSIKTFPTVKDEVTTQHGKITGGIANYLIASMHPVQETETEGVIELPAVVTEFYRDSEFVSKSEQDVKLKASCKECHKVITGNWKPTRVTSNFISHIKVCSPVAFKTFEDTKASRKRKLSDTNSLPVSITTFPAAKDEMTTQHEKITGSIAKYLIASLRPISEIEDEGFTELLSTLTPSYHPPGRKEMQSAVLAKCEHVVTALKSELNSVIYCSGQADIWSTQRMHEYFGMIVSYIQSGSLRTRLLACRQFLGSHTGEQIANMFSSVAKEFRITHTLSALVTDNSTDNSVMCYAQADVSEVLIRLGIEWELVQEGITFVLPIRHSCIACTLQLVVDDGLKEGVDKIQQLLGKCKKLESSINTSGKETEKIENKAQHHIPAANTTCWNSMFSMVEAIVKIESAHHGLLLQITDELDSSVRLTAKDIATLKELHALLEPIATATHRLEVESVPTSGMVLPTVIGLSKALDEVQTPYCNSVKTGLMNSLAHRLDYVKSDDHFILSAILDPRFKLKWTSGPEEELMAKSRITEHMNCIYLTGQPIRLTDVAPGEFAEDGLFGFMATHGDFKRSSSTANEIDGYLADVSTTDALAFWLANKDRYPRLYRLHLKHHSVPATSSALERCFSSAGYVASARRFNLSDELLENFLIAKCNKDLL